MMNKLFGQKTKEKKFWDWFSKNSDLYFDFEKNQEELFNTLNKKLNEVEENLTFEFSPLLDNGKREFVVSADGIKSSFPAVIQLTDNAPLLDKWIIVPFRQSHMEYTQINYKDIQLDFEDVFFRYAKDHGKLGIELNIRGYQDYPDWGTASFLLLDTVLGEYDTEMNLSWIERKKLDENEVDILYSITELPTIMSEYKKEREN
jgi:hypothetical protein